LSASGPKPRSAQMHSGAWSTPVASARPTRTVRAHGPRPRGRGLRSLGRPRPVWPATARRSAAYAGAVTAPGRALRRSWRRRHSGGDSANSGNRAPTTLRLPAGHGERNTSSPELLVDSEEKKSGSTAAFLRRGGAMVAGGGPAMVRREGQVSLTLHGRRTARGELGRCSPWMKLATASDGRTTTVGALGQRRLASDRGSGFGPGERAVGTARVRRGDGADSGARSGGGGASEAGCRDARRTVPTAALNHGVSAARGGLGNGVLPHGPGAVHGV
jgi:hypothetical protein